MRATEAVEGTPILVHCVRCGAEWSIGIFPISVDNFRRVACAAKCCGKKANVVMGAKPKVTPTDDPFAWLTGGDTGISSLTIWQVMTGRPVTDPGFHPDVPHDPADFGRCYRLLKLMPSWTARLSEVATAHPRWSGLVENWGELTDLYEQELPGGNAPKLYERIRALIEGSPR
jgi:hypothetical protein